MAIEDILSKIVVPFGVVLTFLSSLLNIHFTRKSIRSSKYIDTITTERIKWLESIRLETSTLCSELLVLFQKIKKGIIIRQDQEEVLKNSGLENERFVNLDIEYKKIKGEVHEDELRTKLIQRVLLLILRLNPNEDRDIIEPLNHIHSVLQCNLYKLDEVELVIIETNTIIMKTQSILKNEWEKVKEETEKGKLIKR